MCKSGLHAFLQALPKCEHHLHLEGALTSELLFKLAAKNGVQLPTNDTAYTSPDALTARYERFTSLDDFLHYYYVGMTTLQHASDFEDLAWDYFSRAAKDGVAHAEVFFDPQAHLSRGVSFEVLFTGFKAARARAETELGISSELICCFLRHLAPRDCLATFELEAVQRSLQQNEIRGIGLDSSEKEYPPELFTDLYQKAKSLGVKRTAHAGEEGPAAYIRSAIDNLDIQRIDHGIRLAEDPELMQAIAQRGIMLTICPLSNVLLRCVTSVAELPIRKFLNQGVKFSINSDDPAYFGGRYILDNYCAVQDAFDLTIPEWTEIAEASIEGSWCSDERKGQMLEMLNRVVGGRDWDSSPPLVYY